MNTHEDFSRAVQTDESSDRSFGFVFAAVFALVAVWPMLRHRPFRAWGLAVSAGFLLLTLFAPATLRPANRLWTLLGKLLNRVMNPIVTGVLFFLVFTPAAWILKLSGKDPLRLARDPSAASYWLPREPEGPPPATMINQF